MITRLGTLTLLALSLLPLAAAAQDYRATVVGRVTDSSGAAVPGAQVRAINLDTAAASTAVSSEGGDYVIPALQPGRYRLEVEKQNFKKFVRAEFTLSVQERPTLDVALEPGEVSDTVTVTSEAPLLETSNASRGEVITGRTLVDLPLNGRNAFALAALTPGVNFTARGQASTFLRTTANNGISSATIGGGQPRSNEALLDGVPNTGSDGLIQFVPSVDATQEFKVQTNSFDAEFGRFTGGVINATIKSGTNEIHGSAFEFLRNSALNARDPFARTIPQFGYNLFGGTIGGPITLPKKVFGPLGYEGKNRSFFFFSYEGSREGVPRAFVSTVPTALQRQGNFTESPTTIIYDPLTAVRQPNGSFLRTAFAGNVIPAGRIDPIAKALLDLFPLPNTPGLVNNYQLSFKDKVFDNGYVARLDHRFSERHQIFGRYSFRRFGVGRLGGFKNEVTGDSETRDAPGFAFDDTLTVSSTLILNFRYGFSRFLVSSAADNVGTDISRFGFPARLVSAQLVNAIPQVAINGYTTLSGANKLNRGAEDAHTFRAGATKIAGNQTFRFGGEMRLLRSNNGSLGANAAGTFSFNSNFTRGPNPAVNVNTPQQSFASFLLGLPTGGQLDNNAATAEQATYYGFYVQDDFRVTPKLTVNLGVRYEWEGENTERYNRFNRGFAFDQASPIEAQAKANYAASPIPEVPASAFQVRGGLLFAGVGGQPRGLTDLDRNNVAPRVGVAYQLTDKTVLRGGYGLFYGATTQLSEVRQGFSVSTQFVASNDGFITPADTLSNPFRNGFLNATGAGLGLLTLAGQGVSFVDPARKMPFTHQYQFSVQQQLPGQILLDAAYAGSLGRDLPVNQQVNAIPLQFITAARQTFVSTGRNTLTDPVNNPFFGVLTSGSLTGRTTTRGQLLRPFPQFTSVTALNRSIGESRYDALQAKATRRFSAGLSLIASYTFSKQLDRLRFLNDTDPEPVKEINEFDTPHRLVVSGVYELPFGRGQRFLGDVRGFGGKLIEGWQVNVIYQFASGIPLEFTNAELKELRSAALPGDQRTTDRWFDTSVFRRRETLELAALSRLSDVRAPGRNNVDISLFKTTTIAERLRLQFRAESFNAFNRPEFSSPNTDFNSPNFGRITSTNTFARQYQFALKLLW
jgi:hypothetical protein